VLYYQHTVQEVITLTARSTALRKRRWWVVPIILLVVIATGWLVLRWLNPQLAPVTARSYSRAVFTYSANGYGYPAIQELPSSKNGDWLYKVHRLDDRGNLLPGAGIQTGSWTAVSPTRQVLAWYETDSTGVVRAWKDGRITRVPGHPGGYGIEPAHVSDAGLVSVYDSIPRYQNAEGRQITFILPPITAGWKTTDDVESLDPDLLPLCRKADPSLYVYDLVGKRIAVKFPGFASYTMGPYWSLYAKSMVIRHGTRMVVIPYIGRVMIWDGKAMISLPKGNSTQWYWGEDGTVWTYTENGLELLQWRQGTPRLVPMPFKAGFDSRLVNGYDDVFDAVWGDGQLVAHTELRTALPPALKRGIDAFYARFKRSGPKLPEMWQLSLYRRNHLLGRFRFPLHPKQEETVYFEHLAFTADGRYLAWVIDNGDGTHLYVFSTSD